MDVFYIMFPFIAILNIRLLSHWASELVRNLKKKDIQKAKKRIKIGKYRMWFFGLFEPKSIPMFIAIIWYMAIIQVVLIPVVLLVYARFGFDSTRTLIGCTYLPMGLYALIITKTHSSNR